jgi:hypothetical protein
MAKKAGVSLDTAERYWRQAKSAKKKGKGWDYVMGVVKRRLGLESTDLARLGWPIRLLVETDAQSDKSKPEVSSGVFSIEALEPEKRHELLLELTEKGFTVVWRLLEGEVLCVPELEENQRSELEGVLKSYELQLEEDLVDPLLIAAFLLEFYRTQELKRTSQFIQENTRIATKRLMEAVNLFGSQSAYRAWLEEVFPHVDPELVAFMAEQGKW